MIALPYVVMAGPVRAIHVSLMSSDLIGRGSSPRMKSRKRWRRDDDRERRAVPVVLPAAERPSRSSVRQRG